MKNFIIFLVVIIASVGVYFLTQRSFSDVAPTTEIEPQGNAQTNETQNQAQVEGSEVIIGKSVLGRDIVAHNYGKGDTQILLVGGIHGGYSWNTALVAYQTMDYLKANPNVIPSNIKVTIIPTLNPDGLNKAVGVNGRFTKAEVSSSQTTLVASRFNANNVDLSRNFDCDWQSVGKWQTRSVSGGSKVFSEPESLAIKNYVDLHKLSAVVVWYSSAGGVYASSCGSGISPETSAITNVYAKASGYPAYENFDFYETTGDMVSWLAKNNIPAISVLLSTHEDTEWEKNRKGIEALLEHYAK